MKHTTFNRAFIKVFMLITLSLTAFGFTAKFGLDGYEIYLNNKLILKQYVNQPVSLRILQLDKANEGDELRIAVADSGPGPRDGDQVFDLGVTTKRAAGHGIGLALVRQAVTRLGGRIHVTGSRFAVTLPIAGAPATDAASAPPPAAAEATTDG